MTLMSKHVRVKQLAIRIIPWPAMGKAAITVPAGLPLAVAMTGWPAKCTAMLAPTITLHIMAAVINHLIASLAGMLRANLSFLLLLKTMSSSQNGYGTLPVNMLSE